MENKKSVLITGASGGIGSAIAKAVALAGYEVVAHYNRNAAPVEQMANEIREQGGSVRLLQFNIRDREQCKAVLEKDIEENGVYYGVVTNAGVCADTAFPAMTDEYWDKVIDTNLNGFYNVLHPIVMPMSGELQRVEGRSHRCFQSACYRTCKPWHYGEQRRSGRH